MLPRAFVCSGDYASGRSQPEAIALNDPRRSRIDDLMYVQYSVAVRLTPELLVGTSHEGSPDSARRAVRTALVELPGAALVAVDVCHLLPSDAPIVGNLQPIGWAPDE